MSYQPSIAEFIASNKRKRDDEVIQLSDLSGDSPVSNEEDEDDTDKEKSNPEPLPKKKKRIALREREQFPWIKEVDCLYYCKVCSANSIAGSVSDMYFVNKGQAAWKEVKTPQQK